MSVNISEKSYLGYQQNKNIQKQESSINLLD